VQVNFETGIKVTLMAVAGILLLKIIFGVIYIKGLSETVHSV